MPFMPKPGATPFHQRKRLLRAQLLMVILHHTQRTAKLMEQLDYNLLFSFAASHVESDSEG